MATLGCDMQWRVSIGVGLAFGLGQLNVGALIIRIGFWDILYFNCNKGPQNLVAEFMSPKKCTLSVL